MVSTLSQSQCFKLSPFGEFALLERWYDDDATDLKLMQPRQEAFLIGTRDGEFRLPRIKYGLTAALGAARDSYVFRITAPNTSTKFYNLYIERRAA